MTWIIECKHWKSAVTKAHVLTLAQIAQDVGADRVVLLSEKGFQAGAISVSRKSNVLLTSLEEPLSAAADSIADLSIERSLLAVKKLERELQEILFDYGPRELPPPELEKTITLLGACLEVTMTVLAAQTGRFPVRLPSMLSGELPLADELPAVADALASEVAEALEPNVLNSKEFVRLVRHLMATGSGLLSPLSDTERERILQRVVAAMRAVGDRAECRDAERRAASVKLLGERFLDEYVPEHCKASTAYEYRHSVKLFIEPRIGRRKVAEIQRSDIAALHHAMRSTHYQVNRTLGVLSKIFNMAEV